MGAVPQKVLNWVYSVLTNEYRDVNRTYSDVAQTLSYHPSFSLRTDVYTYEGGQSSLLLNLAGTLPVSFRGTTYMFPISTWVPHEYPRAVPMTFVTPTKNMAVRPGQYVSGEGRIYHPYLAGWREDRSNLLEFMSILQEVFAREPPVISRDEQILQPAPPSRQNRAPPPVPPLPPELGGAELRAAQPQALPTPQSGSQSGPPPPPPKPFEIRRGSQAMPPVGAPPVPPRPVTPQNQQNPIRERYQNGYNDPAPPGSQYVPSRNSSLQRDYSLSYSDRRNLQRPEQHSRPDSHSPVSPITPAPHQTGFPSDATRPPQPQYTQQVPPPSFVPKVAPKSQPVEYRRNQQQYSYIPQQQQESHQSYPPQQQYPQQQQQPFKPNLPEDLLTSPFETALPIPSPNIAPPPIPPNPQKDALLDALSQTLTQQVQSTYISTQSAIPPLRAQQAALTSSLKAINTEISQLNDLESLLCSNEAILHQAMRDADKVLEDAKRRKIPSVGEVLVAPTVVAGQLYELVADERSLEECRGVVGRALDKGRIGGDVWSKQTRSLAREEFLKKALIKKVAKGMGLATEERWE